MSLLSFLLKGAAVANTALDSYQTFHSLGSRIQSTFGGGDPLDRFHSAVRAVATTHGLRIAVSERQYAVLEVETPFGGFAVLVGCYDGRRVLTQVTGNHTLLVTAAVRRMVAGLNRDMPECDFTETAGRGGTRYDLLTHIPLEDFTPPMFEHAMSVMLPRMDWFDKWAERGCHM